MPQPTMRNPIQYGRPTRSATSCEGICTYSLNSSQQHAMTANKGSWQNLDQYGLFERQHNSKPCIHRPMIIGKSSSDNRNMPHRHWGYM